MTEIAAPAEAVIVKAAAEAVIVKAAALLALWRQALSEGWGYIYKRAGQVWTAAEQRAATRAQTVEYGAQWIGKRVADCSGLAAWAFRQLGGYVFHGSNTIWNQYVTGRCALKFGVRTDGKEILPGDPVFKKRRENGAVNRHHIGYYVGNGTVIEAKGTRWGVVTSRLEEWDETAHWLNVEYEGGLIFMGKPTLKRGDKGADVVEMQGLLARSGYALPAAKAAPDGIDGVFGANTEAALRNFQQDHGLTPDGVCGDQTWDALERAAKGGGDAPAGTVNVSKAALRELRQKALDMIGIIDGYLED